MISLSYRYKSEIIFLVNTILKGYALKDVAVWWLMKEFSGSFERVHYTWEDYLQV